MANAAARRRGLGDPAPLAQRTRTAISVQLWRRAVAMARGCLPLTCLDDADLMLCAARGRLLGVGQVWGDAPGGLLFLSGLTAVFVRREHTCVHRED